MPAAMQFADFSPAWQAARMRENPYGAQRRQLVEGILGPGGLPVPEGYSNPNHYARQIINGTGQVLGHNPALQQQVNAFRQQWPNGMPQGPMVDNVTPTYEGRAPMVQPAAPVAPPPQAVGVHNLSTPSMPQQLAAAINPPAAAAVKQTKMQRQAQPPTTSGVPAV